jgi:hypothetical protein
MTRFFTRSLILHSLIAAVGAMAFATMAQAASADEAAQEKKDVRAIKDFLGLFHDTWETGPTRLTNKAIEKAYPEQRFYYVFSSGKARKADKTRTSQVVQIDKRGKAHFTSHDSGMMKITGEQDAKVVGAAIMSLSIGLDDKPFSIDASDVTASHSEKGWTCKAKKNECFFEVTLAQDGKFEGMSRVAPARRETATTPKK